MPETGLLGGTGLVQLKAEDKVLFEKPHGKSSGEVRVKLWDLRTELDLGCVCLCPASSSVCVLSSSACQHGERLSNTCLWRSLSQSLHTLPSALIAALWDFHLCSQAHPPFHLSRTLKNPECFCVILQTPVLSQAVS